MHRPVLVLEVVQAFTGIPRGDVADATVGEGGHAEALLEADVVSGVLVGTDADPDRVAQARGRLTRFGDRARIGQGDFKTLAASGAPLAGALFDLGLNSAQVDDAARGFSFRREGPLDMRYDRTRGPTALEWLASVPEEVLSDALHAWGEERYARRVARSVGGAARAGRLRTTLDLAQAVRRAVPGRRGKIDKATRAFQAVRMAVNDEVPQLEAGLDAAWRRLVPGGRLAVISYHSIEDRIVKRRFLEWARVDGQRVTRKPIRASREEVVANRRSRSARLRVIEKRAIDVKIVVVPRSQRVAPERRGTCVHRSGVQHRSLGPQKYRGPRDDKRFRDRL